MAVISRVPLPAVSPSLALLSPAFLAPALSPPAVMTLPSSVAVVPALAGPGATLRLLVVRPMAAARTFLARLVARSLDFH